ncbi:MAG: hypothetical protein KDA71_16060 [Planctomycetales bacterium]|nr:hypothetical protein [Planctomycetales bacterium]
MQMAVGTAQTNVDHRPLFWALLAALEQRNLHTQVFYSRSHFVCSNGAIVVTGQDYRHLDSWLMSRELCRQLFAFGSRACDAAIVEGQFAPPPNGPDVDESHEANRGGDLDQLCEWLELPKLAIIDVTRLHSCCLPPIPSDAAALLLDNVADEDEARRQTATIQALTGKPVLGWLPQLSVARDAVAKLNVGQRPDAELCRYLGEQLASRWKPCDLRRITLQPRRAVEATPMAANRQRPLCVAVAFDDAFQCYFQDSFDMLEAMGATLRDFSPLRGDVLPCEADIVYFGCGPVARHAYRLARNCCMREAIRRYVQQGGRIYAECGGLAYLGKQLQLPSGGHYPMAGILPISVKLAETWRDFEPTEMTLRETCWIGRRGQKLRGYLNPNWQVTPLGPVRRLASLPNSAHPLVGYQNVIGSQVHINFAAHADLLRRFFLPPRNELLVDSLPWS